MSDTAAKQPGIEAFSFGDPTPVLDKREILDYVECYQVDRWYAPPISFHGLAKSFRSAVHHSSPVHFKANVLASCFKPHRLLSRQAFHRWALDYIVFGNCYMERRESRLGRTLTLEPSLAKYTRRGIDPGTYWFVRGWGDEHQFEPGAVCHLMQPDINQEIYGLPEYLAALNSAWLNESATLFRRKYYLNGSHAGFILYMTDTAQNENDVDNLRQALKESKGPGNFRNLFMYSPNGKKDGLQVIPISEVAAKDEIMNIKNVTRDDMLAAHRVPPVLMGVIPNNVSGFGDVEKAAMVFARNEIKPMQNRFLELNDWLGEEVVQFDPYAIEEAIESASAAL